MDGTVAGDGGSHLFLFSVVVVLLPASEGPSSTEHFTLSLRKPPQQGSGLPKKGSIISRRATDGKRYHDYMVPGGCQRVMRLASSSSEGNGLGY